MPPASPANRRWRLWPAAISPLFANTPTAPSIWPGLSLFLMIDHNWALSLKEIEAGRRDAAFLIGSGAPLWLAWVLCTVAGHLMGSVVAAPPDHPLYFAALCVFIALLLPMWRSRRDLLPWVTAGTVAFAVSRLLPGGSWHIVAGALSGAAAGALRDRRGRN